MSGYYRVAKWIVGGKQLIDSVGGFYNGPMLLNYIILLSSVIILLNFIILSSSANYYH